MARWAGGGRACWGLASGAGLGISEAISYSSSFYNGIDGTSQYLVRFISCVTLHAVWTGAAGIFVYQQRKSIDETNYFSAIFGVIVPCMLLHGLYDTFLKKDYNLLAMITAVASFALLAKLIEHMRKKEENQLYAPAR